jgi:hypothetical protein
MLHLPHETQGVQRDRKLQFGSLPLKHGNDLLEERLGVFVTAHPRVNAREIRSCSNRLQMSVTVDRLENVNRPRVCPQRVFHPVQLLSRNSQQCEGSANTGRVNHGLVVAAWN